MKVKSPLLLFFLTLFYTLFSSLIPLFSTPLPHTNKRMSLTFESPTHRGNGTGGDAYFTLLNMPSLINTEDNNNTNTNTASNTPYYTAPINPSLHQDFLNAIQARQATQPTVLLTPIAEKPPMTLTMPMHRRQMTPHHNHYPPRPILPLFQD